MCVACTYNLVCRVTEETQGKLDPRGIRVQRLVPLKFDFPCVKYISLYRVIEELEVLMDQTVPRDHLYVTTC